MNDKKEMIPSYDELLRHYENKKLTFEQYWELLNAYFVKNVDSLIHQAAIKNEGYYIVTHSSNPANKSIAHLNYIGEWLIPGHSQVIKADHITVIRKIELDEKED